ncbi:hypothetical protein CW304_11535 [Bacillus sp. UFRGS-B20]|nr:hypothetical protein CW304_11535 [Bacillus sp. UFRGS-B20]
MVNSLCSFTFLIFHHNHSFFIKSYAGLKKNTAHSFNERFVGQQDKPVPTKKTFFGYTALRYDE